ncbi:hypothetical protein [Kineosporia succinea]|uniref:DUF304 domain-containing protein n=1 Tax=Kineosporia succinea TaxID=84632 RepID=A0ABT9PDJ2_9ACTN|nr:hypothetical protein [Kineosporia succinea]MDP9830782.1 hypothetical protein [Kineosporia succinea]
MAGSDGTLDFRPSPWESIGSGVLLGAVIALLYPGPMVNAAYWLTGVAVWALIDALLSLRWRHVTVSSEGIRVQMLFSNAFYPIGTIEDVHRAKGILGGVRVRQTHGREHGLPAVPADQAEAVNEVVQRAKAT